MPRKKKFHWSFLAGVGILLVLFGALFFYPEDQRPKIAFHQDLIEGDYPEIGETEVNLQNVDEVFGFVFSSLRDQVKVYPSENYYYFVFKNRGREVWGNLHLPPAAEVGRYLDFAYWIFEEDPGVGTQVFSRYKRYDNFSGLVIQRLSPLGFQIDFGGKPVFFELNNLSQAAPKSGINKGEIFVERTFDESGHQFLLVYNSELSHFMFVLDEDRLMLPEELIPSPGNILIGEKSGFAFYQDGNRKILFAISANNVRKNNYYDGPFDQLADNFVPAGFSAKLEAAYPYSRGRLDGYGRFTDVEHSRLAVTPYYFYEEPNELSGIIKGCGDKDFYDCLTHDFKEDSGS
ncbi:MAG: hypothetical protein G01um101419_446 [Parcubacteria group bacterium Gr01-1014_19]|nr:MAG: hypothetical protein G01um101419_446 [Parcubacteria group bacterium Gr01-1014_19]